MKRKRIALFDDHYFFRESIRMILEDHDDFLLAGSFEDANNLIRDIEASEPDVVLMDIGMPGQNGITALATIRREYPDLPVIMLTQHDDEENIIHAIGFGARGYLLKTSPSANDLVNSINDVLEGGSSLNPVVAQKVMKMVAKELSTVSLSNSLTLSPREKEVLDHLARGKSYKMISSDLGICYDTVRMHIKSIYQKLKVSSISGAVAIAVKNRLVRI
jgi:DNA-binding NarL/FixJ family response regulator